MIDEKRMTGYQVEQAMFAELKAQERRRQKRTRSRVPAPVAAVWSAAIGAASALWVRMIG